MENVSLPQRVPWRQWRGSFGYHKLFRPNTSEDCQDKGVCRNTSIIVAISQIIIITDFHSVMRYVNPDHLAIDVDVDFAISRCMMGWLTYQQNQWILQTVRLVDPLCIWLWQYQFRVDFEMASMSHLGVKYSLFQNKYFLISGVRESICCPSVILNLEKL